MKGSSSRSNGENKLRFLTNYLDSDNVLRYNAPLLHVMASLSPWLTTKDYDERLRWALFALSCTNKPAVHTLMCYNTTSTSPFSFLPSGLFRDPTDQEAETDDMFHPSGYFENDALLQKLYAEAQAREDYAEAELHHQAFMDNHSKKIQSNSLKDLLAFQNAVILQSEREEGNHSPNLPENCKTPCDWRQFQLVNIFRIIVLRPVVFWTVFDALGLLKPNDENLNQGLLRIDTVGISDSAWHWIQKKYIKQSPDETNPWLQHENNIEDPAFVLNGEIGFIFERQLELSQQDNIHIHTHCVDFIQRHNWYPKTRTDFPYIKHAHTPPSSGTAPISDCHLLFYLCIEQYIARYRIEVIRDLVSGRPLSLPIKTSIHNFCNAFPDFFKNDAYHMQLAVPKHALSNPSINFNWHGIPPLVLSASSPFDKASPYKIYLLWELLHPSPASNPLNQVLEDGGGLFKPEHFYLHIDPFIASVKTKKIKTINRSFIHEMMKDSSVIPDFLMQT